MSYYSYCGMIVKLFTLPDKSRVEKKVQELETILSALQKKFGKSNI